MKYITSSSLIILGHEMLRARSIQMQFVALVLLCIRKKNIQFSASVSSAASNDRTDGSRTAVFVSVSGVVRAPLLLLHADRRSRVGPVRPDTNDRGSEVRNVTSNIQRITPERLELTRIRRKIGPE